MLYNLLNENVKIMSGDSTYLFSITGKLSFNRMNEYYTIENGLQGYIRFKDGCITFIDLDDYIPHIYLNGYKPSWK